MDNWQLKILSGPHQGAEITLSNGSYIIGTDASCDIVLSDPNLCDKHLQCQLDDNEPSLLVMNHEATVKMGEETLHLDKDSGRQQLSTAIVIISIDTLHFAIGRLASSDGTNSDSDPDWDKISIPVQDNNEKKLVSPPSTDKKKQLTNKHSSQHSSPPPLQASKRLGNSKAKRPAGIVKLLSAKNVASGLSLVLGLLTAGSLLLSTEKPSAAIKPLQLNDTLTALNKTLDISQLSIIEDQQGQESIKGYLHNQQQVKTLARSIEQAFPDVRLQVYANDEIIKGVTLILNAHNLTDIQIIPEASAGVFLLQGRTDSLETWQSTFQTIKRDIAGVKQWKTDINIANNASDENSADNALSIGIKSISVGNIAFVTALDEKKYFVGSVLESGYTISKITNKSIHMQRGDQQTQYTFGDQ